MNVRLLVRVPFALCFAAVSARAQQVIDISGANFRPMPVAVAPPIADASAKDAAQVLDETLLFDLTASGIFQMLERKGFLADAKEGLTASSIQFSRWADIGAEALVKTQVSKDGPNVKGELRLFAVATGKESLKLSESKPAADARRIAHVFADALYRHFTREPGAFQTRIAYVKKGTGTKDVWLADWDGRGATRVSGGGLNILPTVTPDGMGVAYTTYRRGQPEIFVQKAGGAASLLVSAGQMATGLAYSPNGSRIAYAVANGEATQLWVANTDGSDAKQVTSTPYSINTSPSWSPDGQKLAFVSNRGGSPQIYVMPATGGDARRLTFQGNYNQTPDWSPRGDVIAFTARDERNAFDLFTVNATNGKIVRLTQDTGNNEEPTFSPNGRMMVFTSNRNGFEQLFVMTADGEHQAPLFQDKGTYSTPDWGPLPR